jgi:hypothetical protein
MPGDEAQPRNAVGIIGRIEPFEDTVETWKSYTERLEQYFEVNDIAEDKKVPALLTLWYQTIQEILTHLPQYPRSLCISFSLNYMNQMIHRFQLFRHCCYYN